jgi:hypothetical protein
MKCSCDRYPWSDNRTILMYKKYIRNVHKLCMKKKTKNLVQSSIIQHLRTVYGRYHDFDNGNDSRMLIFTMSPVAAEAVGWTSTNCRLLPKLCSWTLPGCISTGRCSIITCAQPYRNNKLCTRTEFDIRVDSYTSHDDKFDDSAPVSHTHFQLVFPTSTYIEVVCLTFEAHLLILLGNVIIL